VCVCVCVCVCEYINMWFILLAHSIYLCVGDDRVRGTREQMMLQVDSVRLGDGAGITWEFL